MSNRFDSALLNRENTRRALAEALDAKYDSERRRARFAQLLVVSVIAAAGFYVAKGAMFVAEHTKPMDLTKKIDQMKKQMADGDQMLITGKPKPPPRSYGGKESFEPEKIPPNLAGDLKPKSGPRSPGYASETQSPIAPEVRSEAQRKARRSGTGKYRPATPQDLAKLPQQKPPALPKEGRYIRVAGPGPTLIRDKRAFPDLK